MPLLVKISSTATTNVTATWVWDSANPHINLRTGSLASITIPSIAAGACADAYFEVEVDPVAASFDTTRRYHIVASDGTGSASTPTPRELYVEHLVSQARNEVSDVKLNGMSIPASQSARLMASITRPRVWTTLERFESDHQRTLRFTVDGSSSHGITSGAGSFSTPTHLTM